jgi:hypothetical protein
VVWGGSLNRDGSDYIRKLKDVEKILRFLESFKKSLGNEEKATVTEVIDIITNHFQNQFKDE